MDMLIHGNLILLYTYYNYENITKTQ